MVGTEPPETIEEAVYRGGELEMSVPRKIEVVKNGQRFDVHGWEVKPRNEDKKADDDSYHGQAPLIPGTDGIPF